MQEKKKWARVKISSQQQSLYKSRVTILGFGKIGIILGRLLKQFGCSITGIKRTEMASPDYFSVEDNILTFDELESVLPETDHLVCALPGGEETNEIIKPRHFKKLLKTSFLYNVGRGNTYKESDLTACDDQRLPIPTFSLLCWSIDKYGNNWSSRFRWIRREAQ